MKYHDIVTFLSFNEDGKVERVYTETKPRVVYANADGTLKINYISGYRTVHQCGKHLIAFGSQRMPCRKSAQDTMKRIIAAGTWEGELAS